MRLFNKIIFPPIKLQWIIMLLFDIIFCSTILSHTLWILTTMKPTTY